MVVRSGAGWPGCGYGRRSEGRGGSVRGGASERPNTIVVIYGGD